MPTVRSRHRLPLVVVAALFVAATIFYTAISIYYYSQPQTPEGFLGIEYSTKNRGRGMVVTVVAPGSAAEAAGLRVKDDVVAVNGRRLDTLNPLWDAVARGHPGDTVRLTVVRGGDASPVELEATLRPRPRSESQRRPPRAQRIAETVLTFYPVPATLVGLAVLLLRLGDRHAWLLALLFSGLATGALGELEPLIHPALRGFAVAYVVFFGGIWPGVFYALLATLPAPSLLDRRVPWLKTALLAILTFINAPLAVSCLIAGSTSAASRVINDFGGAYFQIAIVTIYLGALALGFVSLALNCAFGETADVRRKGRLLAWTFAVGTGPWLTFTIVALIAGRNMFAYPFWVWASCVLCLMLLPVMFAYAVLRHRVLEFSVLVRRSARYVIVQRGFVLATIAVSIGITALFAVYGAALLPRLTDAALPVGIGAGALFGLVVVRTGGAVARRVERRIDRAFFREAYDARRILEDLAQATRAATSREQLASLLEAHVVDALHPREIVVYLKGQRDQLERAMEPECLVPLLGRRGDVIGLLALGPRLSEELYSKDDSRLLASVAGNAALALESLMLAEEMAERIDAERRAAQEVTIAGEVQRRLLPRKTVAMTTVDYAGACRQARAVGGDYYDFLDLGPGQLGLALGDVSGKGLYAALLTVNLQANLRSLSTRAASDLGSVLEEVNRSFFDSTAFNHFATLFVAHYDDRTRRLRYANCGHCPPFLLRADGAVERLVTTASAVGMFESWTCGIRDTCIRPGDLVVIFSDGVTEAMDADGRQFGEAALLTTLEAHRDATAAAVLDSVVDAVLGFSAREQHDDLTLLVVRGLAGAPAAST